jgi:hypothetical protein
VPAFAPDPVPVIASAKASAYADSNFMLLSYVAPYSALVASVTASFGEAFIASAMYASPSLVVVVAHDVSLVDVISSKVHSFYFEHLLTIRLSADIYFGVPRLCHSSEVTTLSGSLIVRSCSPFDGPWRTHGPEPNPAHYAWMASKMHH